MKYLTILGLILSVLSLLLILAGIFIYNEMNIMILGCCLTSASTGLIVYAEKKKQQNKIDTKERN